MRADELHAIDFHLVGGACPDEGRERALALLTLVHGVNRGVSTPLLGVDFPAWDASEASDDALVCIRVLGQKLALEMFGAHPGVRRVAKGALRRGALHACPPATAWARVCRDNALEKSKPSYRRRQAKRHDGQAVSAAPAPRASGFALPLSSVTTRQSFAMRLRKLAVAETPAEVEFSSYGLCKTGAVPQYPPQP